MSNGTWRMARIHHCFCIGIQMLILSRKQFVPGNSTHNRTYFAINIKHTHLKLMKHI